MVLLRTPLLNCLQLSCINIISLSQVSHGGFCSRFIIHPSLFLTKGLSTPATGDSRPAKPKSLSSIFLNRSADSQDKKTHCLNHEKAKNGKREENKLPQMSRSSISRPMQEKKFPEELSPEAALLLKSLHEELHPMLEPSHTPGHFASRHLLKSAAEKLGQRHQEIAKWLSGSDLKKIALFGCPSIERKTVFASKRLRSFFCIQEDIVCRGCKLKTSCNFVNQRVDKVDRVILADVMRLLTVLAFDAVPQQLSVPADLKVSVDKLLKEAVNLSH